jgi:hypothetical protein
VQVDLVKGDPVMTYKEKLTDLIGKTGEVSFPDGVVFFQLNREKDQLVEVGEDYVLFDRPRWGKVMCPMSMVTIQYAK